MEKIYSKEQRQFELVEAKQETVQFLLNFSKSLEIIEAKGIQFEAMLN